MPISSKNSFDLGGAGWIRLVFVCLLAWVHAGQIVRAVEIAPPESMTCRDAKMLPAEIAGQQKDILLHGTVTCVLQGWKGFFISDETGGIYCEPLDSEAEATFWPVAVGEEVSLVAITCAGKLNSYIQVREVIARSPGSLPNPHLKSLRDIAPHVDDADFVRIRGVMVRVINVAGEMIYGLIGDGIECDAVNYGFRVDPKLPAHTEIEIQGVVIPTAGPIPFKIAVSDKACFRILRFQDELVADTPLIKLPDVIHNNFPQNTLVRFQGQLFRHEGPRSWLVADDHGVEWIGELDPKKYKDQSLEVTAFVRNIGDRVWLEHGEVVGQAEPRSVNFPRAGDWATLSRSHRNQTVAFRGALVDRLTIDNRRYFIFESEKSHFSATMVSAPNVFEEPPLLQLGAIYQVGGVVTTPSGAWQDREIQLQDFHGLQFVSAPPLSAQHKLLYVTTLSTVLAIGLCISAFSYRHLMSVKSHLEAARNDLKTINDSLQSKIAERTKELQHSNDALTIAERRSHDANQSKSMFLANMSHEIRTPMTAILGFTELLLEEQDMSEEQRKDFLTTIQQNGHHLLAIINDILDLSKIEAGKLAIDSEACSPEQIVRDVLALMKVKADTKNLRLECEVAPEVPITFATDAKVLRQILINLVGNAIKFTQTGKIVVSVTVAPQQPDRILFQVKDSGIGISPEHCVRLFHPFEQVDNSSTRPHGGTGLGLCICKRLTELLEGSIDFETEAGKGSTFRVSLPLGLKSNSQVVGLGNSTVVTTPVGSGIESNRLSGMRVLFAEDGLDNQRLIAFHLRRAGVDLHIVENGLETMEAMCEGSDGPLISPCPFDLIITDMQMPIMDGYSSVRLLRDKGCKLPIIALTAHAMVEDAERSMAVGCNLHLSKPVDRTKLLEICQTFAPSQTNKNGVNLAMR